MSHDCRAPQMADLQAHKASWMQRVEFVDRSTIFQCACRSNIVARHATEHRYGRRASLWIAQYCHGETSVINMH